MNAFASAGLGALGGAAVLAVALFGGDMLRGPAGVQGPAGAVGPQGEAGPQGEQGPPGPVTVVLGASAVVLVRDREACPEGMGPAGEVRLLTAPDYTLATGQTTTNPGVFTTTTMGWSDVNFFLCAAGTP